MFQIILFNGKQLQCVYYTFLYIHHYGARAGQGNDHLQGLKAILPNGEQSDG